MKQYILLFVSGLAISGMLSAGHHYHGHHHDYKHWVQKFDTNDNGTIEYAEFAQKMVEKFNRMDTNGDGLISEEDRSNSKHRYHRKYHRWSAKADTDNDGVISQSEFTEKMQQHFAEKDANKDNTLDIEEIKTWHKAHRLEKRQKKFSRLDKNNDGVISKEEFIGTEH